MTKMKKMLLKIKCDFIEGKEYLLPTFLVLLQNEKVKKGSLIFCSCFYRGIFNYQMKSVFSLLEYSN